MLNTHRRVIFLNQTNIALFVKSPAVRIRFQLQVESPYPRDKKTLMSVGTPHASFFLLSRLTSPDSDFPYDVAGAAAYMPTTPPPRHICTRRQTDLFPLAWQCYTQGRSSGQEVSCCTYGETLVICSCRRVKQLNLSLLAKVTTSEGNRKEREQTTGNRKENETLEWRTPAEGIH